jgi:hypothetical protein
VRHGQHVGGREAAVGASPAFALVALDGGLQRVQKELVFFFCQGSNIQYEGFRAFWPKTSWTTDILVDIDIVCNGS